MRLPVQLQRAMAAEAEAAREARAKVKSTFTLKTIKSTVFIIKSFKEIFTFLNQNLNLVIRSDC